MGGRQLSVCACEGCPNWACEAPWEGSYAHGVWGGPTVSQQREHKPQRVYGIRPTERIHVCSPAGSTSWPTLGSASGTSTCQRTPLGCWITRVGSPTRTSSSLGPTKASRSSGCRPDPRRARACLAGDFWGDIPWQWPQARQTGLAMESRKREREDAILGPSTFVISGYARAGKAYQPQVGLGSKLPAVEPTGKPWRLHASARAHVFRGKLRRLVIDGAGPLAVWAAAAALRLQQEHVAVPLHLSAAGASSEHHGPPELVEFWKETATAPQPQRQASGHDF